MTNYDIWVDYDILCTIEDKLRIIDHNIGNSSEKMNNAIHRAQDFLAGNQFEKAKQTSTKCLEMTSRTQSNIKNAEKYLENLRKVIEEYGKCVYAGE